MQPAVVISAVPQSTECVRRDSNATGIIAGVTVQRKRSFLFNKKTSESEEPVKVLNVKKLVTETC